MSYVLSHSLALAFFAAAMWLPGWLLERAFLSVRGRPLRRLARVCLGLGFWSTAAFLLAALGQLHRTGVGAVLVSMIAAAATLAMRGRNGKPEHRVEQSREERGKSASASVGGKLIFGTVLAALLGGLYLLAMSPPVSWDADVYHLTLPRLYLEAESFRPVPMSVYSSWPLGTEMLFALAMLAHGYTLAKLVHFAFGLLVLWGIALACRELGRPRAALLAAACWLANPVVLFEMRVAYVDLAYAFYLLAAFLFMRRALDEAEGGPFQKTWLLLAGLCAGLLVGVKVTGAAGAVVIFALALPTWLAATQRGEGKAATSALISRFALPVALFALPWLVKAAWATGNPIYPLVFGGPDWSPELGERFATWQRSIGMGRGLADFLLLPLRVVVAGGQGYARFDGELGLHWLAMLPMAIVFGRRKPVCLALAAAGLTFALWALGSQQMRFLIPTLPLLAVAASVAVADQIEGLTRWRSTVWAGALLLAAAGTAAYGLGPAASGFRALGRYAASSPEELATSAIHPVYRFIDEQLPKDARLLLLNTNRGFFIHREYLADSFFEASQIASWLEGVASVDELLTRFAERRITHLLVERRNRGIAYPPALIELFEEPSRIERLYRSPDDRYEVLALRPENGR